MSNIGGDSQSNILSRTFPTMTGETYAVDFDAGIWGQHTVNPLQFRVRAFETGTDSICGVG